MLIDRPVFTWLVFLVTNPYPKATKGSLPLGYLIIYKRQQELSA